MDACQGCKKRFPLNNSNIQENGIYDINLSAVWITVSSGGGCSNLNVMLGTMNMSPMSEAMFTPLAEKKNHEIMKPEMVKTGVKERRIAIEKGNYHEGVPAITVESDGGWSKRTHKHTYNALGE